MQRSEFEHEYDLNSLVLVKPQGKDFSMYVTPRYREHYEQLPFEEFSAEMVTYLLLDRTRLFIDVGAHYGFYSLLAGSCNRQVEVIAFEPIPETFKALELGVAWNRLTNVALHSIAVSNQDGTASINVSLASDSCGFHSNPQALALRHIEVRTQKLDSLLANHAPCSTLIKIDTEGHELAVLQGLASTLTRFRELTLLIEFNPMMQKAAGYPESALLSYLQNSGFDVFLLDEKSHQMIPIKTQEELSRLVPSYGNLYCVRPEPVSTPSKKPRWLNYVVELSKRCKFVERDQVIGGWCFGQQNIHVRALRARRGSHTWIAQYGLPRDDVAQAFPSEPTAARSGFSVSIKVPILPGALTLEAMGPDGRWHKIHSRYISRWRRLLKVGPLPATNQSRRKQVKQALPLIREALKFNACVLAVSHSDYRIAVAGTQKLLQQEEALLAARNISYLEIHPAPQQSVLTRGTRDFLMGLYVDSKDAGLFTVSQLIQIFTDLNRRGVDIRMVHLQHLMGFPLTVIDELMRAIPSPKRCFIHDFYTVCPQCNLLKDDQVFCGGPPLGAATCGECRYGKPRVEHFQGFQKLFAQWNPEFISPSEVARKTWLNSYPQYADRIRIVPHQTHSRERHKVLQRSDAARLRIAFIGYQHPIKGWEEWKQLTTQLPREHYECYVLGSCTELLPHVTIIPVSFIAQGPDAMIHALSHEAIDMTFLWSLVPETYSFTLFESMAAGCFLLTNPHSGNIAAQVTQSGRGLVLPQLSDLIDVLKDIPRVRSILRAFRENHPPFDLIPNATLAQELCDGLPSSAKASTPQPLDAGARIPDRRTLASGKPTQPSSLS